MLSPKQQTDTIRDSLVNIVEHVAAKESNNTIRHWWGPKTELKEKEC